MPRGIVELDRLHVNLKKIFMFGLGCDIAALEC